MKTSVRGISCVLLLLAIVSVGSLPTTKDVVVHRETFSTDLEKRAVPALVTGVSHASLNLVGWVCKFGSKAKCITSVVVSLLSVFFAAYYSREPGRRSADIAYILTDFEAVPGCDLRCAFRNNLADGDWHTIGNSTYNGIFHSLEYIRMDNGIAGLRAGGVRFADGSRIARQDTNDSGGITGEYYWDDGNENNWNDVSSSGKSNAESYANTIDGVVENNNADAVCASFTDPNGGGVVDQGLMVFDNNDSYGNGGLSSGLGGCST